jgi:hypothetical protein
VGEEESDKFVELSGGSQCTFFRSE